MVPIALFAAQEVAVADASDPRAPRTEATSNDISIRAVGGVGAGDLGPAARIGLQDEYWFARHVGFGIAAGTAVEEGILAGSINLRFAAGSVSFRSSPDDSWWIAGLSPGYAYREEEYWSGCLWEPCSPGGYHRFRHAFYVGATGGFLAHAGPVELGPLLQLDAALADGSATTIVTLNLALGFATD